MKPVELLTGLLTLTTLLAVVARRLKVSYPILLVLVGLVIGFLPQLPDIELGSDVVFLIFLPPLLYGAAWSINNADLRRYSRSVGMLAIGLVVFTASLVALVSVAVIPGFTWAEGFLLGAIISPPDAVAASSVMRGLHIPKRMNTILEGESLVNDATSLVLYRFALAAVLTGKFSLADASIRFVWSAVASVALGLAVGWVFQYVHRSLRKDPISNTAVTLLIPYSVYLLAEHLDVSGVLAVVTTGLFLSWRDNEIFSDQTRLQAYTVWDTLTFLLNGLVFILIGLQLPKILEGLNTMGMAQALGYAAVVVAVVIISRMVWMFPGAYLPRRLSRRIRESEPEPRWQEVAVMGWAGMRGVVSLASALAVPALMPNGQPFPNRPLILFLTFVLIFATLVIQGLSLPLVIKWLGVHDTTDERKQEREVRRKMAQKAVVHLESNYADGRVPDAVLNQVKGQLEQKVDHLNGRVRSDQPGQSADELYTSLVTLRLELIEVERSVLNTYRLAGDLDDELIRKLGQELDLEAIRLSSSMPLLAAETIPPVRKGSTASSTR